MTPQSTILLFVRSLPNFTQASFNQRSDVSGVYAISSIHLRKLFSLPEIANRLRKCSLSALSPISVVEAELAFWRKREPLEKLHNITTFIKRNPQRREDFQRCCKVYKVEDLSFEGMCRSSPRTWHLLASHLCTELVAIGDNLTRRSSTYDSIMRSIGLS
jgi:hypothetical protein